MRKYQLRFQQHLELPEVWLYLHNHNIQEYINLSRIMTLSSNVQYTELSPQR